jgi:hypothetical protein
VRPTAARGATERATKVACCSSTESSTEAPKPSFRISTPNSLALAAAPYSLAQATLMSKGRTWSAYQGRAGSLKPWTSDSGMLSSWSMRNVLTGAGSRYICIYQNLHFMRPPLPGAERR